MLDLSLGMLRGPGVVYQRIGTSKLGVQRFLDALTSRKFLFAPTTLLRPCQPKPARGVDKQQYTTKTIPTGLQKQRGIEHGGHNTGLGHVLGLPIQELADFGMGQFFQVFSLGGAGGQIGKHDFCQPGPIDVAVGGENLVSPSLSSGGLDRGHSQHFVSTAVRVQDTGPQLVQLPGHETLSTGHATKYPDYPHIGWFVGRHKECRQPVEKGDWVAGA